MGRYLLWVGVLALVLGSTGTARAVERPFRVTGSVELQALPPPGTVVVGTVIGTYIGQGSIAVTASAGTAVISWGPFAFCYFHGISPFVITASNGDQIFGDQLIQTCQTANSPPLSALNSGFYRITGGTGRFLNATGRGFFSTVLEIPGTATFTAEGTINY
jgi:hypothetical protein